MSTPYLQKPNYLNAMQIGFNMRQAEKARQAKRNAVSVPYGGRDPFYKPNPRLQPGRMKEDTSAPFSPERRANEREAAMVEEANKEKVNMLKLASEQKGQDVEKTKIETAKMGLQNAVSYTPQLSKSNYRDWYNWVMESDFVPSTMFINPDVVERYTPEQFDTYTKKLESLKNPNPKMLQQVIKMHEVENNIKSKAEANRLKEAEVNARIDANKIAKTNQTEKVKLDKDKLDFEYNKELAKTAEPLFVPDQNGVILAIDKEKGKVLADTYNILSEKLGKDTRIVWNDEPVIDMPGKWFGSNKKPGYVMVEKDKNGNEVKIADFSPPVGIDGKRPTTEVPVITAPNDIQSLYDKAMELIESDKYDQADIEDRFEKATGIKLSEYKRK